MVFTRGNSTYFWQKKSQLRRPQQHFLQGLNDLVCVEIVGISISYYLKEYPHWKIVRRGTGDLSQPGTHASLIGPWDRPKRENHQQTRKFERGWWNKRRRVARIPNQWEQGWGKLWASRRPARKETEGEYQLRWLASRGLNQKWDSIIAYNEPDKKGHDFKRPPNSSQGEKI